MALTSNTGGLVKRLQDMRAAARDLTPAFKQLGQHMKDMSVPENFRARGRPTPWAPSPTGQDDTGRLKRSVHYAASKTQLRVGTNVAYARQRQEGGTIKAAGKLLAIPFNTGRTKRRPGQYKNLHFVLLKKGNLVGMLVERLKTRTHVRFWLVRKVTQPARPFLLWHPEDIELGKRYMLRRLLLRRLVGGGP